jgi:hypothetical protein
MRYTRLLSNKLQFLLVILIGCSPQEGTGKPEQDQDEDGYSSSADCDDTNADIRPGAIEVCDLRDNDCDDLIDEQAADAGTWYADSDGDGYGADPITACERPSGTVEVSGDCDDADATAFPGASEVCDGVDQDCDGEIDEGAVDTTTWYEDLDGDGYGSGEAQLRCEGLEGETAEAGDCDDSTGSIYPGAAELCDGADQDCDGEVDEAATDATAWYADLDGDGFGSGEAVLQCDGADGMVAMNGDCGDADPAVYPGAPESDCADPLDYNCDGSVGYVDADGDGWAACEECDDGEAGVNPDAPERCDGVDQDCDTTVDEGVTARFYVDGDGDGYGDPDGPVDACALPSGHVTMAGDCQDDAATIHPGAFETCDGIDEDCDTVVDDAAMDGLYWYTDADGDGHGDPSMGVIQCEAPTDYVSSSDDCDDRDGSVYPGAEESCDDMDEDCDGVVDEDAAGATLWYADADADGFGDASDALRACSAPFGYVADDQDCDDTQPGVNPDAIESCDGEDEDCNGEVDENAWDAPIWYVDADGDGHGDDVVVFATCAEPAGYSAFADDCDDSDGSVHPGAEESCDDIDEDCDGMVDEDAAGAMLWYADADADGFGEASEALRACRAPSGYVADDQDCDDTQPGVNPDAIESCDGEDEDCDGDVDVDAWDAPIWYIDADGDGHGDDVVVLAACTEPAGYASSADDCDDDAPVVYPGADEWCGGVDHDCDGLSDETSSLDALSWYLDGDGDRYGYGAAMLACLSPAGRVANDSDCDDGNSAIHPGAAEICDSLDRDEDCDSWADDADPSVSGRSTVYEDTDGDTFGGSTALSLCDPPAGAVATSTDCDDLDAEVHPGAVEVCDAANTDEDCDGLSDDSDPSATGRMAFYLDADGDTFGSSSSTSSCDLPVGFSPVATDCDDNDANVHPGAIERCDADNKDEDCNGVADDDDPSVAGRSTFYLDADLDGHGGATSLSACEVAAGYVSTSTDCDDTNSAVHPGAVEVCDPANTDEDCDGFSDDADTTATGASSWFADADGDGHGGPTTVVACDSPAGHVSMFTDCDDANAAVSPSALEQCDAADVDEDCDGLADDADSSATGTSTFYLDADGDGHGASSASIIACDPPFGCSTVGGDCDDLSAEDHPGASEVCVDGDDDDCDGIPDQGCPTYAYAGTYAAEGSASDADHVIYGQASGDEFGMAVASGVDFEGDGYDNLIVGSDNDYDSGSSYDPGRVYVYNGFPGGPAAAQIYREGSLANYYSATVHIGTKVWGIEDVNGDGHDELGFLETGGTYRTYVWEGDQVTVDSPHHLAEYSSQTGGRLSSAGGLLEEGGSAWVNGDPFYVSNEGVVYVYSGTSFTYSLAGEATGDYAGYAISGGRGMDCDGDGFDDLAIGAYGNDSVANGAGAAYVVLGPMTSNLDLADADLKLTGLSSGDYFGYNLKWAGDADDDGRMDLWVAAPGADLGGSSGGVVSLFVDLDPAGSGADETAADYEARVYGAAGDLLGGYTTYGGMDVGDANGDGDADLLLGSSAHDVGSAGNAGAAWLLYGPFGGSYDISSASGYDAIFQGNDASDLCGASVAFGDLDADGLDDIVMGCSAGDYGGFTSRGTVWMFLGG